MTRDGLALAYITLHVDGGANRDDRGMGHSACLEELDDVETFLGKRLPPKDGAAAEETGKSEL